MTLKEVREANREARLVTADWEYVYHPTVAPAEYANVTQSCRHCGDCHEMFFEDEFDSLPQDGWEYDD